MSITARLDKLEQKVSREPVASIDLARLTPEERAELAEIEASAPRTPEGKINYMTMRDADADRIEFLFFRCTAPEPQNGHGAGMMEGCDCTYCNWYDVYHGRPLPPPAIYTREWYAQQATNPESKGRRR